MVRIVSSLAFSSMTLTEFSVSHGDLARTSSENLAASSASISQLLPLKILLGTSTVLLPR